MCSAVKLKKILTITACGGIITIYWKDYDEEKYRRKRCAVSRGECKRGHTLVGKNTLESQPERVLSREAVADALSRYDCTVGRGIAKAIN